MVQTPRGHLTSTLTTHWSALWQMRVGGGGVGWAKEGRHANGRKVVTSAAIKPNGNGVTRGIAYLQFLKEPLTIRRRQSACTLLDNRHSSGLHQGAASLSAMTV